MRGICSLVIVVDFLVSPSRAEVWTLERAILVALKQSPDALIARQRATEAEAIVNSAQSNWYPQVSLQGSYMQTNSPMMAFGSILNQRAFNLGLNFNHPGQIDNLNGTGTVAYNLYSGGRVKAGVSAARAGSRAALEDLRAAQNQLSLIVVKSYFEIIKARQSVLALDSGVNAYEAAVVNAQARYEAGQLFKADLLSLKVQLAQTKEQLSSARSGVLLSERSFCYVLGIQNAPGLIQLQAEDTSLQRLLEPQSINTSLRPELASLRERLIAAEEMVRVARGARQPSVNAFATYQVDQGFKLNHQGNSWSAGLALDLNIFDGGKIKAGISQSAAELGQVKEMMRKLQQGIALEAEQARLSYENAKERLEVSVQSVDQAKESVELTRARFDQGLLATADLIGVESRYIEAQMRRTFASSDERIALASYRSALGLPVLSNP